MLVGRGRQAAALTAVLDEAARRCGAVTVVRGEAGIGKSALLAHVSRAAGQRGFRVVTTSGIQAEVHIPYAALHRLTRSLSAGAASMEIDSPFRAAVRLLEMLGAVPEPVLVAVEDAHWLDPGSWEALTFAARRIGSDAVAMVLTVRDGEDVDRLLAQAGLPEMRLEPLDLPQAGELLDRVAAGLAPALRQRVLEEAAGNPLGLVELGAVAARSGGAALLPSRLPLSTRVERTFAMLVGELPPVTRSLLLVAAADDGDGLDEMLAACGRVEGRPVTAEDIEPAVVTRLVEVDAAYRLRFRHPLLRSALYQSAGAARRRRAHAALAEVTAADPARQVWHRAAAASGPDEALARELTETAMAAGDRQAGGVALAAFERAVQLSEDPAERGRRQLAAVNVAVELGDGATARRILGEVAGQQLRPADQAWLSYMRETHLQTGLSGTVRFAVYAELVDSLRREGDLRRAVDAMLAMTVLFVWSNPDAGTARLYLEVADRLGGAEDDPRLVGMIAMIAPIERGAVCLERIARLRTRFDLSPFEHQTLGLASSALGALDVAAHFYAEAATGARAQGRIGVLAQLLSTQAFVAAFQSDSTTAMTAATEGVSLAAETGQRAWGLTARLALGHAHALRGDGDAARQIADLGESVLLTGGRLPMMALVQTIRGVAALAEGRPQDAYRHFRRVFDPADTPYHVGTQMKIVGHVAEAAAWSGQGESLRELIAPLRPIAEQSRCPSLLVGLRYADAVLAGDAEAYEAALAADLSAWPFERARLQHSYGTWLRRRRRGAESRPLLRAAATTFDALGARPWADRCRAELRASGETLRRPADAAGTLTPQELQIAALAAEGLSNPEIAERLFLSPRTISTHLYRIYPKLGIKSRGELSRALSTIT
ncbi:LuxR family transcriptional regulator [Paractinoplanes deccanensis]|uniref:LuxR family transcriptional regulator n=1 Tax=Paractinoplanes deccanensis TaxID=113561 RepID=A0ABQ3YEU2_9ACTN|nr:helix-turn-helix transcriptional regulator [Actinoplanes deccanensis]GID78531.1 LuxR family transcriptional regulator [Actinoplanes deccanensis]